MLQGKKIILGITGSIAAYKSATLTRLLIKQGAEVQVLMTCAAEQFITPLTLSTLSQKPVYKDFVKNDHGEWTHHVELGLWADLMVIAPATAHFMAQCAQGLCPDLLSATYLSARCPVVFAPAMDLDMWQHKATQDNLAKLHSFGHHIISPTQGELASGLYGTGRMEEPEAILSWIQNFFDSKGPLKGQKVLVTAGPTQEAIDPVRYISNHSSGKMGFAIAKALVDLGAEVNLVAGPVHLPTPAGIASRVDVITADEMYQACMRIFPESKLTIMAAAVADFAPEKVAHNKIKKQDSDTMPLQLKATRDILAEMGAMKKQGQCLVGFALETERLMEHAKEKLEKKKVDFLIVNKYSSENPVFGADTNHVFLLNAQGEIKDLGMGTKKALAQALVNQITPFLAL